MKRASIAPTVVVVASVVGCGSAAAQTSASLFDTSGAEARYAHEFNTILASCDSSVAGFTARARRELHPVAPVSVRLSESTFVMFGRTRRPFVLTPELEFDLVDLRQAPVSHHVAAHPWMTTACRIIVHEATEYARYTRRHAPQRSGESYPDFVERLSEAWQEAHVRGVEAENMLRRAAGVSEDRLGRCNVPVPPEERVLVVIGAHTEVQQWEEADLKAQPTFILNADECKRRRLPTVP